MCIVVMTRKKLRRLLHEEFNKGADSYQKLLFSSLRQKVNRQIDKVLEEKGGLHGKS